MGWRGGEFMRACSGAGEPGAARTGALAGAREDVEVKLLVELHELALCGGGEELGGHGGQHAVVAHRVVADGVHQFGRHQAGSTGAREQVFQAGQVGRSLHP